MGYAYCSEKAEKREKSRVRLSDSPEPQNYLKRPLVVWAGA